MKKLALAGLCGAALLASFMGCSKKADSGSKAKAADKTILVFGAFRGEEAARFEEIVKIFNEKHPEYNVVYEGSPEFETQIQVQAEAGTPPDIAALPQPGMMKNFAAKGYIKPLGSNVISCN